MKDRDLQKNHVTGVVIQLVLVILLVLLRPPLKISDYQVQLAWLICAFIVVGFSLVVLILIANSRLKTKDRKHQDSVLILLSSVGLGVSALELFVMLIISFDAIHLFDR